MVKLTLNDVLDDFGLKATEVRLLKQSVNTHWEVRTPDGRYVLRLFARDKAAFRTIESARWECNLLRDLAARGAPVAQALSEPKIFDGDMFGLFAFAEGDPWEMEHRSEEEYRALGRMLAELHETMALASPRLQRPGWFAFHDAPTLQGDTLRRDELLRRLHALDADVARIVGATAIATERRLADTGVRRLPLMPVHGDFSAWNITRRPNGALACVFDFDLAHMDIRAADVCFSRRADHDGVVRGYRERLPLADMEVAALDALWIGANLQAVWRIIEARGPVLRVADLRLQLEHFIKTRPYRD